MMVELQSSPGTVKSNVEIRRVELDIYLLKNMIASLRCQCSCFQSQVIN